MNYATWWIYPVAAAGGAATWTGWWLTRPRSTADGTVLRHRLRRGHTMVAPTGPTLYDLARPLLPTLVEQFYRRIKADPALAPAFEHLDGEGWDRLKRHQALLLGQALGGPAAFTPEHLGEVHATATITNHVYAQVVRHLLAVLYDNHVPADIITALTAAVEELRPHIVNVR